MSNEVHIFSNMQTCIFLIILLGFIQLVFCSQLPNVSESTDVCPATWVRRKRANLDYTRWRSNMETTPEFIVKVLDDEISTASNNQIVAVNILPLTKRGEKIIVGGAMVPAPTMSSGGDLPRDYTRFVPPTTTATPVTLHTELEAVVVFSGPSTMLVTNPDVHPPIKPEPPPQKKPLQFFAINKAERNSNRDESPPAGPQFLTRPSVVPARQYAPIAPVSFGPRPTHTPFAPPSYDRFISYVHPTRSSTIDVMKPSRTPPDDIPFLQAFLDDVGDNGPLLTRTTLLSVPTKTTLPDKDALFFEDDIDHYHNTKTTEDQRLSGDGRKVNKIPEGAEKDDSNYNLFSDGDDYKDIHSKRVMDYDSKVKHEDDNELGEKYLVEGSIPDNIHAYDVSELENKTAMQVYPDSSFDTEFENETGEISSAELKNDGSSKLHDNVTSRSKKHLVCNMIKLRQPDFNTVRTLPEIVAQLKKWTEESPVARWTDITGGNLTTMENPIYMMIVDDPSVGQVASEKQNVLLISGIQGRDHYAVAAAMHVLYQLIERRESHTDLLDKYRFWVIPVFNPDGYDYSMTFPQRRHWVKNLRQTWDICKGRESCRNCDTHGLRCTISPCYGVNLDRNFEYQWIPPEELRAEQPCGALYAGPRQLSEAETQALSNYLHHQHMPISIFIAFKEGEVLGVMYPFSHTKKKRAYDQTYRSRANRAAAAAYSVAGRAYFSGQNSEFLPLYAGGIEDWADGHLGIDNTYTVMLFRPTDMPSHTMSERVVHEAYAAMDSLLISTVANTIRPPVLQLVKSKAPSLIPNLETVFLACLASFLYSLYKNTVT